MPRLLRPSPSAARHPSQPTADGDLCVRLCVFVCNMPWNGSHHFPCPMAMAWDGMTASELRELDFDLFVC